MAMTNTEQEPGLEPGYTEVTLILRDETVRHILTGEKISDEEYMEIVAAMIRSTGAV